MGCGLLGLLVARGAPVPTAAQEDAGTPVAAGADNGERTPKYEVRRIRGRVVWLAEAVARLYGVESMPEAVDRILAIQSPDGALVPLIEDVRGRAFRRDPRLRELEVELTLRFYDGVPAGQIIGVVSHEKEGTFEIDYWCDVCAIPMYELKPCECCQGEIRFRRRPVNAERPAN